MVYWDVIDWNINDHLSGRFAVFEDSLSSSAADHSAAFANIDSFNRTMLDDASLALQGFWVCAHLYHLTFFFGRDLEDNDRVIANEVCSTKMMEYDPTSMLDLDIEQRKWREKSGKISTRR